MVVQGLDKLLDSVDTLLKACSAAGEHSAVGEGIKLGSGVAGPQERGVEREVAFVALTNFGERFANLKVGVSEAARKVGSAR